jgi:SAM-dependent methyltransferase
MPVGTPAVEEGAMAVDRLLPTGTGSWQPTYIDQHAAELSHYLDQVSRSDALQRVAECALALMSPMAGRSVLEVGCGNGVLLARLAEGVGSEGRVVGVDHSATFVEQARAQVARAGLSAVVTVQQADAYALPFAAETFDLAHCERVLMHLEQPTAALAEMRRVVRPGGWLIAVEPDWAGIRIDHEDREGMDILYARAMRIKQPDMGITLYRRMGELGLTERRLAPLLSVNTDFEALKGYGLALAPVADALVSEAWLTRERADGLLSGLEEANATDRFYSVVVMHIIAGRVPERTR